jgi:hypothetical protein
VTDKDDKKEITLPEVEAPVGGGRKAVKKVTLEFELEKVLKIAAGALLLTIVGIYGYKYISTFKMPTFGTDTPRIAVMNVSEIRDDFFRQNNFKNNDEREIAKLEPEFRIYTRKLMALYRLNGFLVIDSALTFSIPSSVKIVTYIDGDALMDELKSLGSNENFNEVTIQ